MIDFCTRLVVWLNTLANAVGKLLLAPVGVLPGWLSATLVAGITGVLLLVVFKHTSNQRAIKRVKDDINANLLALKLFKESVSVALRAQGSILYSAGRLMLLAIVPMLVMVLPVLLILGQLSLWYQSRPLQIGEDAVVTLKLLSDNTARADARLEPTDAVEVLVGPVFVPSKQEVCWKIKASQAGYHQLIFHVGNEAGDKELVVGDRIMRVSSLRPDWSLGDVLLYPAEKPFDRASAVQSIAIDYPTRSSWTSGADTWVIYWFAVSMVFGFAFRRVFNVNM
ncbi:MAG TPA: hypothetical protein VG125_13140 [Pirellulales bacterium]|nr:hypothetical protein [Pirellulales bacterium]